MCMFSGSVEHVANTRIFARMVAGEPARQALIYIQIVLDSSPG